MQHFDIIVAGAGSGGLTAAVGLQNIGKSVLLIEREHIGGECTHSGCIPSKALLHHAKTYAAAISISGINGHTEDYRREAFSYVRNVVGEFSQEENPAAFSDKGITVVMGEAIFAGTKSLTVNGTQYSFHTCIIATGSRPRQIEVPGLNDSDVLTNQNLFTLEDIPKRTLIIGAGPIGLEMGQALTLLGSQVTIVDSGLTLGKLEDPSTASVIQHHFNTLGITFIGEAHLASVRSKTATIETGSGGEVIGVPFDKVLVAIGRIPNLPTGLEVANVTSTEFGISVNHNYQTRNHHIYALGDCADRFKFTHQADDIARQVVARIATKGLTRIKTKHIPKVTYTDPELAQIGLSETEAITLYGSERIHRIEVPLSVNDRARTDSATNGIMVVIARRFSGKILGVHMAGPQAGELLAVFTVAMEHNLSLWKLRRTMFAYPTYSLLIKKAGDYFFAAQVKSLRTDCRNILKRFLPKLIVLSVWVGLIIAVFSYQARTGLTVTELAIKLFDLITKTAWGPILYILAYTLRPITFIPGTILTVLSGVFFGLWGGVFYTLIGANLSATLAYAIGRYFSNPSPQSSSSLFGRFSSACRTKPFMTILTMRLLFLPYDGVNYGAGFLRVPFMPYIIATIVGSILGITTFVAVGASLSVAEISEHGFSTEAVNSTFLLLSFSIFVASLVIARILQRKK